MIELFLKWCDALAGLQIDDPEDESRDGGILCPACSVIHGRCHEAVYPLMCAAKLSGDARYLSAAKRLFSWGKNMRTADGAFKNDFTSDWKGVTVFAAIALHDALKFHGDLLEEEERAGWEARLLELGEWLNGNLTEKTPAYLNYYAANACALALTGKYFGRDDFLEEAGRLAAHCLRHVSENGLIFGEGRPNDALSEKGCRAIDIGYNVEETLPCLGRYASTVGDEKTINACGSLWRAHLDWMLPDGAWDNSVGTRSFKWTYWGSRTSDGCQAALFELGRDDPVFAEAAVRNLELLGSCTGGGLLFGGPDYEKNGEKPCVHHTFCHAKVLASALDSGPTDFRRAALPSDDPEPVKYYPELDTFRVSRGKWRMTVSGYDFSYRGADHASGGSISLLWHEDAGALVAVGMVDYSLREPNNQQLSVDPGAYRCSCPRIETTFGGKRYGQHYCKTAGISAETTGDHILIRVKAHLCGRDGQPLPEGGECRLEYRLSGESLIVNGQVSDTIAGEARFICPLSGEKARLEVCRGSMSGEPARFFNLSPGFSGKEYIIAPDAEGRFGIRIHVIGQR